MKQSESYEGFKLITQKTMDLVNQKEVVLPSTYRVVFSGLAKKYQIDIGAESIRSNEEVYSHVLALDANTNRAIEAIRAGRLMQLQAHVIRYGGDEFLLIFERQALNEVHDIVNVMRELHRKRKIRTATHEFQVSFAYGITPFEAGERFSEVVAKADAELYEDKAKIKRRIA